jgi:hypothetical protein
VIEKLQIRLLGQSVGFDSYLPVQRSIHSGRRLAQLRAYVKAVYCFQNRRKASADRMRVLRNKELEHDLNRDA